MKNIKTYEDFLNEELFGLSSKEKYMKTKKKEQIDKENEDLVKSFHHDISKKFNLKDFNNKNCGGIENIKYNDSDKIIDKSPLSEKAKEANDRGKKITYKQSHDFRKRLVAITKDDVKIYLVNGTHIRDKIDIDLTMGGHAYVYPNYIPENEIWIDEDMDIEDQYTTIVHEMTERNEMRNKHLSYSKAHEDASEKEKKVRKKIEK